MTAVTKPSSVRRVSVLGSPVDCLTSVEFLEEFVRSVEDRRVCRLAAINASICISALRDPVFQKMQWEFELANADGKGVELGARLFLRLPVPEHAATPDLVDGFLTISAANGYRIYFFGSAEDVISQAVARAQVRWPGLLVVGHHHGFVTPEQMEVVVSKIRHSRADALLVGLPSPMKESWTLRYGTDLGVPLILPVGGLFDVIAGRVREEPDLAKRLGMAWFFRMVQQPKRLAPRYVSTLPEFVARLALEGIRVRVTTVAHRRAREGSPTRAKNTRNGRRR